MNEDDDWEELDENAMEECMVLATQLCSKQPSHYSAADDAQNNTQHLKTQHFKSFSEADNGRQSNLISNESLSNVHDSGVCSSRNSNLHQPVSNSSRISHPPVSNSRNSLNQVANTSSTAIQKKEPPQSNYRSRFSDFSSTTVNIGLPHTSLTRKSSSSGKGQVPLVTSTKGSPSKMRSPGETMTESDGNEENAHLLHKAQEEKKKLVERIITMQGEISLLRSELKRKETALEAERLDHCAAIEAAEKRGREKVAKQTVETNTKLKEKGVLLDKLQGELHFKKREVEELLIRCHQLEQLPESSQTPGPAKKRPRIERTSTDSTILSRFDFGGQGAAKVCSVEVQTESFESKKFQRTRLDVALPKGWICQMRSVATLLSSCALASTSPASSTLLAAHCGTSDSWSLPSEWLTLISQALRKNDVNIEHNLVTLAVERLLQTHTKVSDYDVDHRRATHICEDPTEWYESQVGPAIQILSHFKFTSELNVLKAITAHLPPLSYKDVVVNRRIRVKLLEAAERVFKNMKCHMERTYCESLSLLRECCGSIESDKEARILMKITSALIPHSQLCIATGACLIGQLCKKVKKLCVGDLGTLRVLLDLTWGVVKVAPASSCLSSPCPCSSQLLGTFLWHMYQVLESYHLPANKRKMCSVVVSCIHVLHHWSVADPDWWDKVSHFSQYPVLMVTIAAKAEDMKLKRDTVDLLCDLYEFEEGTFER